MLDSSTTLQALQSLTPEALCALDERVTLPDARKIVSAAHRPGFAYAQKSGVRRQAMEAAREKTHLPALSVQAVAQSRLDPFMKLALRTGDDKVIEAVRIPLEKAGRFSVCVSSQVGCALACAFCATGRLGLLRNLEAWEIIEQVRLVRDTLGPSERVHGVVFQGMGEPLANLDRVLQAISVMSHPCGLQIDQRHITVCTSGLPQGIERLAREAPKVRLGISFSSARRDVRATLMPIEKAHSLDDVIAAAEAHVRLTDLAPMWAVTLLAGVNDTDEDAQALAERAQDFARRTGRMPRLSILAYNSIGDDDPFERVALAQEQRFRDILHVRGIASHRRYSGGSDVAAACGQLAAVPTVLSVA